MARKDQLLGSTLRPSAALASGWTPEKMAELDRQLQACQQVLEKSEVAVRELQSAAETLHGLRQQLPKNADVRKMQGVLAYRVGQYEEADLRFAEALELAPNDVEIYTNRAAAQRAAGNLESARESLEAALGRNPDSAIAHRNLGNLLSDQGAYSQAAVSYARSLQSRPDHAATWHSYVFALVRNGQLHDAMAATHQAAAQGVDRHETLRTVGQWLVTFGRGVSAVAFYGEALQIDDEDIENLRGMAVALMQAERPKDAAIFLDRALERDPEDVGVLSQKAGLALQRNDVREARGYLERAMEVAPNAPGLLVDFASVLFREDNLEEAERYCRKALRMAPNLPSAHGMLAQIARTQGDFDASVAHAEKIVQSQAPQKGGAMSNLYAAKKDITEEDDVAMVLAKLEAQEVTSKKDLAAYNYTLGELFHKLKSPERAIFFFKAGNDLRRIGLKADGHVYKRRMQEAQVTAMTRIFSRDFLEAHRRNGLSSERPVFIVGMPRSGTTLTEQIVSSHPLAHGAGELPKLSELVGRTTRELAEAGEQIGFPGWATRVAPEKFAELAQAYLDHIGELNGDALRVTDKMPHNFMNVGLIALMFPNARIVHCMRDPVDNCLSCFQQHFQMPHTYSTNLADLGHHYREYRRLMAHWRQVIPNPVYEVQYEELVADQERVSRELIAFCGLEWDDACLSFNKQKRAVKTASVWQVRQPIYTDSVKKWKPYEPYIGDLLDELNTGMVS